MNSNSNESIKVKLLSNSLNKQPGRPIYYLLIILLPVTELSQAPQFPLQTAGRRLGGSPVHVDVWKPVPQQPQNLGL